MFEKFASKTINASAKLHKKNMHLRPLYNIADEKLNLLTPKRDIDQ